LAALPGLRPAGPGEFTRRAFLNGKLDLAQVEGLADLVDAETDLQRRQAQRQLSGVMRDATAPWRAALIAAAAECETAIDFAEDVVPADVDARVAALLAPVREGLRAELAAAGAAERIRDGVQVVIAGPPNAGKSSLLNALTRREAAIVSTIAGTTRDPIEVHLDLAGCPLTLVDTAGLRVSADAIEQIGMSRARARAKAADLVLWLADDGTPPPAFAAPVWAIATKADLAPFPKVKGEVLPLSTLTGQNLDVLVGRLAAFAQNLAAPAGAGLIARARHRDAFAAALAALDHATASPAPPIEIVAEHLRAARFALDRLIGAVDVEDILGDVFARFCIGK
ncbi:MAG: tRNA uridine-5-carboxymethylaminomethyl(34) synthesis GTPase MnmE, partial [Beijerinckiaceae bacterium]|nr:tRNA uridine-5-carboxymethylaminomethyl(34) synthesis GTPase MnmE [Beijerinckiaceae bacterium]